MLGVLSGPDGDASVFPFFQHFEESFLGLGKLSLDFLQRGLLWQASPTESFSNLQISYK